MSGVAQPLSDEKRQSVLSRLAAGDSPAAIAREVDVSRATVYTLKKALAPEGVGGSPGEGGGPQGANGASKPLRAPAARTPEGAQFLSYVPRSFSMDASLVFFAQRAVEQQWGWPHMEPGEFINAFLFALCAKHGIWLTGYIATSPPLTEAVQQALSADNEPEPEEAEEPKEPKEPAPIP